MQLSVWSGFSWQGNYIICKVRSVIQDNCHVVRSAVQVLWSGSVMKGHSLYYIRSFIQDKKIILVSFISYYPYGQSLKMQLFFLIARSVIKRQIWCGPGLSYKSFIRVVRPFMQGNYILQIKYFIS